MKSDFTMGPRFAWYPVRLFPSGKWVWWRRVEMRGRITRFGLVTYYRSIEP